MFYKRFSNVLLLKALLSLELFLLTEARSLDTNSSTNYSGRPNELFNLSSYHGYDEIIQYLKQLANSSTYGRRASLVELDQKTFHNRTIYVFKIKNRRRKAKKKPAIWIDAGLHAREWTAISTALYLIDKILQNRTLSRDIDWYILPVANPDGYEFSRKTNRQWRKNRFMCGELDEDDCCGVDLNRNFDFDWGVTDSSRDECNDIFSGATAASEPETSAIQNFLTKRGAKKVKGYITLHSYGQYWFYPYGHKKELKSNEQPNNFRSLIDLAELAVSKILQASNGTVRYTTGRAAKLIYASSGGSDDWAKGRLGIKYVFCIELPPDDATAGRYESEFAVPSTDVKTIADSLWPGLWAVVEKIIEDEKPATAERAGYQQA